MDPPSLVAKATITEMWPFPLAASGPGGILGVHHHHPVGPARMPDHGPGFLAEVGGGHHRGDASVEESTVTEQSGGGVLSRRKRRDLAAVSEDESSKLVSTCSGNEQTDCEVKRLKVMGSRDNIVDSKVEVEASSGICNKPTDQNAQPVEPPKQDYIHVRARRGQATDNHSLSERARREKISERMKVLQDLVPGCNKVIGKALVLDEIINYIQSLQRQVEFLSMKLEAVNSRMNSDTEGFPAKDFGIQTFDTTSGWHSAHRQRGNSTRDHHKNGCICRLVVDLKEQLNFNKIHPRGK